MPKFNRFGLFATAFFMMSALGCFTAALLGTGTTLGNAMSTSIGLMALGMGIMFLGVSLDSDRLVVRSFWVGAPFLMFGALMLVYLTKEHLLPIVH